MTVSMRGRTPESQLSSSGEEEAQGPEHDGANFEQRTRARRESKEAWPFLEHESGRV